MPEALVMIIVVRTYTHCSNTKQHHTYTPYILMWIRTWIRTWIPETTHMRVRRTLHPRYWRDSGKQYAWGKNIVWPLRGARPSTARGHWHEVIIVVVVVVPSYHIRAT